MYLSKKCSSCEQMKLAAQFQVRKASKDGLTASCKECLSKRDKARDTPERAAQRAKYAKSKGKDVSNRAKKDWSKRNSTQVQANRQVSNAIRDGILIKSRCEVCGSESTQAHHDDYNFPLKIRWLCAKHHAEWHKHNTPIRLK